MSLSWRTISLHYYSLNIVQSLVFNVQQLKVPPSVVDLIDLFIFWFLKNTRLMDKMLVVWYICFKIAKMSTNKKGFHKITQFYAFFLYNFPSMFVSFAENLCEK